MNKKLLFASFMLATMVLAGCGKKDPTPTAKYTVTWVVEGKTVETDTDVAAGSNPSYDGATPTKDPTDDLVFTFSGWTPELAPVTADVTYTATFTSDTRYYDFTNENLGYLVGTFYGYSGELTIDEDGATLVTVADNVVEYTNGTLKGKGFNTVATYTDPNGKEITVSWSEGDKKTVVVDDDVWPINYQPSLESIVGWYTGYGDADTYNIVYQVSNDFDIAYDSFNVGMASAYYGFYPVANYAKSYFIDYQNEVRLGWDFYYSDELTEPTAECYVEYLNNGKIDLVYLEWDEMLFESSVSVFNYSYFDENEGDFGIYGYGLYFSGLDEEAKTVYVKDEWDPCTYVEGYDEKGTYIVVNESVIRPTRFGVTVETEESTLEMPYFNYLGFMSMYDCTFNSEDTAIFYEFDYETWEDKVTVNGQAAQSTYVNFNHYMTLKVTCGDKVYYIIPGDYDNTIKVTLNDVESIFINVEAVKPQFVKSYFATGYAFSIDDNLMVSVGGDSIQGKIYFNDEIGIVFEMGNYFLVPMNEDGTVYAIIDKGNFSMTYAIDNAYLESFLGNWTSGKKALDFTASSMTYASNVIWSANGTYSVQAISVSGDFCPCFLSQDSASKSYLILFLDSGIVVYDGTTYDMLDSFIPSQKFFSIVGTYNYHGENGLEQISLDINGKLVVDTSSSSGTGIEPVEYDYIAFMSDDEVVLEFNYQGTGVDIYFDLKGHASIFMFSYLNETLDNYQGAFTDGTHILSITDNQVILDGTVVTVDTAEDNIIDGKCGTKDVSILFEDGNAYIDLEGINYTLAKSNISLSSFKGTYNNVSDLGYNVIVKDDGIYWGMEGFESKISSYQYVLEGGEVVIKFSQAGIDYTMAIVDDVPTVTGKSNIPVPPPLPTL